MHWLEITVLTKHESVEAISNKLSEMGIGGVFIEDCRDWEHAKKESPSDLFPAEAGLPDDKAVIRGYFPVSFLGSHKESELNRFLSDLPQYGLAGGELSQRVVDDADWENTWKDYWQPTPAGEKLLVVPAWYQNVDQAGRIPLYLDPGAAFGTGTHETTQLCLTLLESQVHGGETILDLGCGSGILAIAARLLGAGSVQGADYDEVAVRASLANAELNQLDISFFQADLLTEAAWDKLNRADIITANLTADIILSVKDYFPKVLKPAGCIILSGIIHSRRNEVVQAMLTQPYRLKKELHAGQWAALLLEMKA